MLKNLWNNLKTFCGRNNPPSKLTWLDELAMYHRERELQAANLEFYRKFYVNAGHSEAEAEEAARRIVGW